MQIGRKASGDISCSPTFESNERRLLRLCQDSNKRITKKKRKKENAHTHAQTSWGPAPSPFVTLPDHVHCHDCHRICIRVHSSIRTSHNSYTVQWSLQSLTKAQKRTASSKNMLGLHRARAARQFNVQLKKLNACRKLHKDAR